MAVITTIAHNIWSRKRRLLATCTAVVLGVAFLTATMIFGDTAKAGFRNAYTAANAGTDLVVRSASRLGTAEDRVGGLLDASTADVVASVDGVADAAPYVEGSAQLVGADGVALGGDGPPTRGASWIDDPALSGYHLVEGRAPRPGADTEVVIDRASAGRAHLHVGDRTSVLTPARVPVTVVGIAAFGDADSLGPVSYVGFDLATAERLLAGESGRISSVLVRAADRVDEDALAARVRATLAAQPGASDLEVITGAELSAEQQRDVDTDFLGLFRTMLLAFAGIAVVVATFSIYNTFSILAAQRTRESALLRAVGASRRQIVVGVAAEALAVGVVGDGDRVRRRHRAGCGAAGADGALRLALPKAGLVIGTGTIVAAAVVGVGTTLLASLGPAVRASRVAPLAALRDVAVDQSATSWRRAALGVVVAGGGVAVLVTATSSPDAALARAGLGALGVLAGAVVLGPVVARPAAAVLGVAPAALRGLAGRLARRNAMRNPRRTASSASALMVGTAVVALFTTFGASVKASIDAVTDDDFSGDLIVLPDGFSGAELSPDLAPAIGDVPGVAAAVAVSYAPARIGGETVDVAATDVGRLATVFDVGVVGDLARRLRSRRRRRQRQVRRRPPPRDRVDAAGDLRRRRHRRPAGGGDLRPADDVRRRGRRAGRPRPARRPAPGHRRARRRRRRGRPRRGPRGDRHRDRRVRRPGAARPGGVQGAGRRAGRLDAVRGVRPARRRRGDRRAGDRQHARPVDPRPDARARTGPGARAGSTPGARRGALGIGDHRPVRRRSEASRPAPSSAGA